MPKQTKKQLAEKIFHKIWAVEHKVFPDPEKRPKKYKAHCLALADALSGTISLRDAALKYSIGESSLRDFKKKFEVPATDMDRFIEGLFNHQTINALAIFDEKKEDLTAMQAAVSASMFAEKAAHMRKARENKPAEETISVAILQKLSEILDRHSIPTIHTITEHAEEDSTTSDNQ